MIDATLEGSLLANAFVVIAAAGIALGLRPWRGLGAAGGPPWPWIAAWAMMPVLWGLDGHASGPLVQPMSGAAMLVLLAGWPLAVLALLPVAAITVLAADTGWVEGLHRLVWLGVAPATLMLAIGGALRRWLPHNIFVYILGRGFLGSFVSCALVGWAAVAVHGTPVGTSINDLLMARLLNAYGEAFITGMLTAILVAFRPQCLATYADRLYLTERPRD